MKGAIACELDGGEVTLSVEEVVGQVSTTTDGPLNNRL